jgi:hypothetical protein
VETTSEWTTQLLDRLPPLRQCFLLLREKRNKGVQPPGNRRRLSKKYDGVGTL